MTIPRNLSFLAEGASSTGVLGTANGGTGLSTVGTNGQVLTSNGTSLSFATPATTNPAGSTGQVQYNNGGAFGAISSGTSGQVLTSAGSGAAPTWSSPSAGAMTLISTQTASNSATISWTGLSGYDKYMLVFENIVPSTNNGNFLINVGTGSGPTYITSGYLYYSSVLNNTNVNTSPSCNGSYSNNAFYLNSTGVVNTNSVNGGISGSMLFVGFTNSALLMATFSAVNDLTSTSKHGEITTGGGEITTNTTAKTAIKITIDSGNIASGTASLYGISS